MIGIVYRSTAVGVLAGVAAFASPARPHSELTAAQVQTLSKCEWKLVHASRPQLLHGVHVWGPLAATATARGVSVYFAANGREAERDTIQRIDLDSRGYLNASHFVGIVDNGRSFVILPKDPARQEGRAFAWKAAGSRLIEIWSSTATRDSLKAPVDLFDAVDRGSGADPSFRASWVAQLVQNTGSRIYIVEELPHLRLLALDGPPLALYSSAVASGDTLDVVVVAGLPPQRLWHRRVFRSSDGRLHGIGEWKDLSIGPSHGELLWVQLRKSRQGLTALWWREQNGQRFVETAIRRTSGEWHYMGMSPASAVGRLNVGVTGDGTPLQAGSVSGSTILDELPAGSVSRDLDDDLPILVATSDTSGIVIRPADPKAPVSEVAMRVETFHRVCQR